MAGSLTRLAFPKIVEDPQNGHWMNITAVGRGSSNEIQAVVTLFIPGGGQNNLTWETKHDYQDTKLSRVVLGAAEAATGVAGLSSAVQTAASMTGHAINPKVEVLYRDTNLRAFQFSFIVAPSSSEEASDLREIIRTLRYYSSPTLIGGNSDPMEGYIGSGNQIGNLGIGQTLNTLGAPQGLVNLFGGPQGTGYLSTGGLFQSPSEFLIQFYYKHPRLGIQENTNIPKIGRCVMEHIDINYAPDGEWSTFHDGMPTSAMITMMFREMRVIDSSNVRDGF